MKKCRITVMKTAQYDDLIEKYENPIEHACELEEGQTFIANGWQKPDGLCDSAWESMSAFVMTLSHGGENLYDGWMKNKKSAMISCNDGFRPVSFYTLPILKAFISLFLNRRYTVLRPIIRSSHSSSMVTSYT